MGATDNCQPKKPTRKEDQANDSNVAENSDDDEENVEGKGLSMWKFALLLLHSNLSPPYECILKSIWFVIKWSIYHSNETRQPLEYGWPLKVPIYIPENVILNIRKIIIATCNFK